MRHLTSGILMGLLLFGTAPHAGAAAGPYSFDREIVIGGAGGWDYLATDAAAHRLYVSHGTEVVVVDTRTKRVIGHITDTPGVHGIAIADDLGRGFVSNGADSTISIVDLRTLKALQKVPSTGQNPDAILYEPRTHEVYAFNGRSGSATVLDGRSGRVVATVKLAGKPEFAQTDPAAGVVYVNIEDKSEIQAIDASTHAVRSTWPIGPGESASGMAIDLAHHRLFIGCDNQMMEMLDSTTGKVLGSVPIGAGVDANRYDAGTGLAFASSGSGTVTIARVSPDGKLTTVQTLDTKRGARTMTLDPTTHDIYLSTAEFGKPAPGVRRPPIVPGSFRLLVYRMAPGGRLR
jgi:DNA-binding beta-propeller fold protein YncE